MCSCPPAKHMRCILNNSLFIVPKTQFGGCSIYQILVGPVGLNAVDAVYSTFSAVLSNLRYIMDWDDKLKAAEATGIYMQVHSFKFLTTLVLFLENTDVH